jgi:hypothetical protein
MVGDLATVAGPHRISAEIFRFRPVPKSGLSEAGEGCRIPTMVDCLNVKVDYVCRLRKIIYAFKKRKSFFKIY